MVKENKYFKVLSGNVTFFYRPFCLYTTETRVYLRNYKFSVCLPIVWVCFVVYNSVCTMYAVYVYILKPIFQYYRLGHK